MSFDVRLLGPDDGPVLQRIAPGVFDELVSPRWTTEFLADARHHLAVALDAGEVVGMASAIHYVHPDKPPQLWINEVAVAPTHQSRGIGRSLVDALLARGRGLGCTEAWVLTEQTNTVARRLYAGTRGVVMPDECVMYTFRLDDEPVA